MAPLTGEVAGTIDPSEIGTSAGSRLSVLNRGTSGIRDLPLSCLSISARLVLLRNLFLTLGLVANPDVSVLDRACTCPTTRSSLKGMRALWLSDSTIASWVWEPTGQNTKPFTGEPKVLSISKGEIG